MKKPAAYVVVCGVQIPIYMGTPDENLDLQGAWGCFNPEKVAIWLDENAPDNIIDDTLTHEVLHVLINRSGIIYELCSTFGLSRQDPRWEAWEEAFVRRVTPFVVETFGAVRAMPVEGKRRGPKKARTKAKQRYSSEV